MLTICCAPRPTANRYRGRHGRQDMVAFTSTHRQGHSSSRSPEYFDNGEQQPEREREVTMTQPAAYARYSQRVRTNANLAKDFVKVKTYSDLIVLKQDAHDKLGEPARWVLYAADFGKSPYPVMDNARAEQWMNMYSILDRSTLEKAVFELIKESLSDFHLASYLMDEVQIGSVDSVSKLLEEIFTTFPVDSRPVRFEYITHCILTAYTTKCDDTSTYNSRLSTTHKARVALGGNTTITVDELFLILEMAHFQSGDKLQKKIYRNTFKILEKNTAESTLTKTVLNEIRKETIALFNEDKAPTLKVLKMDLSKVKGTKCADCCGCQIHCVDYHTNTWSGPRFHEDAKTAGKSDVRALLTNVEEDLYLDHEGNLVTVDDDFSQDEMMHGLA
jgi:hypothetical protein